MNELKKQAEKNPEIAELLAMMCDFMAENNWSDTREEAETDLATVICWFAKHYVPKG